MLKPYEAIQLDLFDQPKKPRRKRRRPVPQENYYPGCWQNQAWVNEYQKKWREENPEMRAEHEATHFSNPDNRKRNLERNRAWLANNPVMRKAINRRKMSRRKGLSKLCTPAWADRQLMRYIYVSCVYLSSITGLALDVDHIIPLKNDLVCGLNIPHNLRIIPRADNLRKKNKFYEELGLHPTIANGLLKP